MRKSKLGRGLSNLLDTAMDEKGKVIELSISKIHPNPWQPRRDFDEESLRALAASIKEKGLIQPITVRSRENDGSFEYELVTGERRLRAAEMAGLTVIPSIIASYGDDNMAEMALIENLQREDLNPIEEGEAYQSLIDTYALSVSDMAERVGKSRSYVANILRLVGLADEVKAMLREKKLTIGQARPLLALESTEEQIALAKEIVENGMSAREIEKLMKEKKEEKPKKPKKDPLPSDAAAYLKSIEEKLQLSVGSRVSIKLGRGPKAHSGTISISFKNDEEFLRITEFLNR